MSAREGHVRAESYDRALAAWRVRVAGGTWEQARAAGEYFDVPTVIRACREMVGDLPVPDREQDRALLVERADQAWQQVMRGFGEASTASQRATVARAAAQVITVRARLSGVVLDERPVSASQQAIEEWALGYAAQVRAEVRAQVLSELGLPPDGPVVAGEVVAALPAVADAVTGLPVEGDIFGGLLDGRSVVAGRSVWTGDPAECPPGMPLGDGGA